MTMSARPPRGGWESPALPLTWSSAVFPANRSAARASRPVRGDLNARQERELLRDAHENLGK
jgi:hypothetical protein